MCISRHVIFLPLPFLPLPPLLLPFLPLPFLPLFTSVILTLPFLPLPFLHLPFLHQTRSQMGICRMGFNSDIVRIGIINMCAKFHSFNIKGRIFSQIRWTKRNVRNKTFMLFPVTHIRISHRIKYAWLILFGTNIGTTNIFPSQ